MTETRTTGTPSTRAHASAAPTPRPDTAVRPDTPERPAPRLTPGMQLHGEYEGSGFTDAQYIAQRSDGQVLQLSRLLYLVASEVDGERGLPEVAEAVSARAGRPVSADNVDHLVRNRLVPAGVVAVGEDEEPGPLPRTDLLFGLRWRGTLLPASWVVRVARTLTGLHTPPVVLLVVGCCLLVDFWLFVSYGAVSSLVAVLEEPTLLLAVAGLALLSLVVHELGHASACCYGGARPGRIGVGLYLVWPALYTDVTDVYRIGRGGRLRTDLGGVYFNLVFILVMAGCYSVTAEPVFLAVVYVCHFEILQQLVPIVRFDGYFILGDLAGVPDLFGKVRPILASLLPRRGLAPQVAGLRRGVRLMVTAWVLVTLPLLVANLAYATWKLPQLASTAADSLARQADVVTEAAHDLDVLALVSGSLSAVLLVLPTVGLVYLLSRIARRVVTGLVARVRGARTGGATLTPPPAAGTPPR